MKLEFVKQCTALWLLCRTSIKSSFVSTDSIAHSNDNLSLFLVVGNDGVGVEEEVSQLLPLSHSIRHIA